MKTITPTSAAALLVLAAFGGCTEKDDPTATDPDSSLGKQVVEAIAKVTGEPHPLSPQETYRSRVNLSDAALVFRREAFIDPRSKGDRVLQELERYAREEFPGTVIDCDPSRMVRTGRNCFPLSREGTSLRTATGQTLPPDGMLILQGTSNRVLIHHYWAVPDTYDGIGDGFYAVDLERLEGGGWKVGEGRHQW